MNRPAGRSASGAVAGRASSIASNAATIWSRSASNHALACLLLASILSVSMMLECHKITRQCRSFASEYEVDHAEEFLAKSPDAPPLDRGGGEYRRGPCRGCRHGAHG